MRKINTNLFGPLRGASPLDVAAVSAVSPGDRIPRARRARTPLYRHPTPTTAPLPTVYPTDRHRRRFANAAAAATAAVAAARRLPSTSAQQTAHQCIVRVRRPWYRVARCAARAICIFFFSSPFSSSCQNNCNNNKYQYS